MANQNQIKFVKILHWLGINGGVDKNTLRLVKARAEKALNSSRGVDADFLDSIVQLCREFSQDEPNNKNISRHLNIVDSYLKSTSPVYVDNFALAG